MQPRTWLFILSLQLLLLGCAESKQEENPAADKVYSLTGTVVGAERDTLILYKPNEDPYYEHIKIPVENGEFRYDFQLDNPIGYDLMYWKNGNPGGRWMTVFLEQSDIELTIYPEDQWDMNSIRGGEITSAWNDFYAEKQNKFGKEQMDLYARTVELHETKTYFTPEMQQLLDRRRTAEGKELEATNEKISGLRRDYLALTDSASVVRQRLEQIDNQLKEWEQAYIDSNSNIIAYYLYFTELSYRPDRVEPEPGRKNLEKLTAEFPDHPYNEVAETKFYSLDRIQEGKGFVDFALPDLNGEMVSLSEKIKGKKAVIDLWATWCKPCILKNRELVPLYHKYKDQNFTIVGVAGEYKDTDGLGEFIVKEQYPWINLVELDGENLIWEKYGISRSGGGLFLVNENGTLVAIDPSVEEIRSFLESTAPETVPENI